MLIYKSLKYLSCQPSNRENIKFNVKSKKLKIGV